MVRTIPPERLRQVIDTATEVFIKQGYQRTQMDDVAAALRVAKGTLYGYVESKAALFDATVRFADGREPLPNVASLPLPTPAPGSTLHAVQMRLATETENLELLAALGRKRPRNLAAELEAIARDLYVRMARNRRCIKLVDRCAQEQPELAEVWFGQGRWGQHAALVAYLEQRSSTRLLRPVLSVPIAARHVLETIAFWAVHRHWDPSPQPLDEESVQNAVVALLLHGLIQEAP